MPHQNRSSSSSSGSGLETNNANGDHYVTLNGRGNGQKSNAERISKSTGQLNDSTYDNPIFTVSGEAAKSKSRRRENMVNGAAQMASCKVPNGMDQGMFHGGNVSSSMMYNNSIFN